LDRLGPCRRVLQYLLQGKLFIDKSEYKQIFEGFDKHVHRKGTLIGMGKGLGSEKSCHHVKIGPREWEGCYG
jgi:hypothetical protein